MQILEAKQSRIAVKVFITNSLRLKGSKGTGLLISAVAAAVTAGSFKAEQ